jgi:hypothetical protein
MSIKAISAIKRYFEADPNGRKVTMDELKACSLDERQELGRLAAEALGEEFQETPA